MSNYVYSTLSTDFRATVQKTTPTGETEIKASVVIKGGHGVANKNLITPLGVVTRMTDEEISICQQDAAFKQIEKNGFFKVEQRKIDPEKAASDMDNDDKSRQTVESDYQKGGRFYRTPNGLVTGAPLTPDSAATRDTADNDD